MTSVDLGLLSVDIHSRTQTTNLKFLVECHCCLFSPDYKQVRIEATGIPDEAAEIHASELASRSTTDKAATQEQASVS